MIKSMTGFGRSEIASGNRKIMVEMKSVNHRFLEASIKMPKKLNVFEARIRDVIKKYASRGKIKKSYCTCKTMPVRGWWNRTKVRLYSTGDEQGG